ncbi:hypothetical protein CEE37_05685 [candidate division LCP-89 bacterium B3_LCP]|uniref:Uncharacterized protein n=1 Tax=candidate division LCP-89 bacterium B3_LCP TaxID=2012998 RepID=A0A532V1W1_UNCL8|nr:MAG: hypothetical protein CEE37_05685 [candidate division LCP-89 bacterium B3_LCP]
MKYGRNTYSKLACMVCIMSVLAFSCCKRGGRKPETELQIAHQANSPMAQQLIGVLMHTDVLKQNNLQAAFNHIQGGITADILILSDTEAIEHLIREPGWVIVSRFANDRNEDSLTQSLVLVSQSFLASSEGAVIGFLQALMDGWFYLAQNPKLAAEWYTADGDRMPGLQELNLYASFEPNYRAMMKGHVSLNLSNKDRGNLQRKADHILGGDNSGFGQRIDMDYLRKAEREWWAVPDQYPE